MGLAPNGRAASCPQSRAVHTLPAFAPPVPPDASSPHALQHLHLAKLPSQATTRGKQRTAGRSAAKQRTCDFPFVPVRDVPARIPGCRFVGHLVRRHIQGGAAIDGVPRPGQIGPLPRAGRRRSRIETRAPDLAARPASRSRAAHHEGPVNAAHIPISRPSRGIATSSPNLARRRFTAPHSTA